MRYIHTDVETSSLFELISIRQAIVNHNSYPWLVRLIDAEIEDRRDNTEDWNANDSL